MNRSSNGSPMTYARTVLVALALAIAATASLWASGADAKKPKPQKLFVAAKTKHPSAACTKRKPCKTISAALAKAHGGATITVGPGTYPEQVTVTKKVTIIGVGKPTINAGGLSNGFLLNGAGASGATVQGFTVKGANFVGILAMNTSRVTIRANTVSGNDLGVGATPPVGECAAQGPIPGDCGEGIHLWSTSNSHVVGNLVSGNQGGILLTDETGPTAHNTISANRVLNNLVDCGITLAGHNPGAVTAAGPQPASGGVFSNEINGNTAVGNGTKGQGGGILLASGPPGGAVYNNTVENNTANGNGLAGITLHSHAPGQDLNGNKIMGNSLSNNGVNGYPDGSPGDSDAGIKGTVDITVFSAVSPLTGTVVSANKLANATYGIWTQNVPTIPLAANTFASTVKTPLFQK
jgi:parallel beta-helix repeat protein